MVHYRSNFLHLQWPLYAVYCEKRQLINSQNAFDPGDRVVYHGSHVELAVLCQSQSAEVRKSG